MDRIYLDYNATSLLRPAARAALCDALDLRGNASSVHCEGREARAVVEAARATIAGLLGARVRNVVFTSGATEAANLALTPFLKDGGAPFEVLLTSSGEHPCVMAGHRFDPAGVKSVPLTGAGVIDLGALEAALGAASGRCMVALQAANNETGVAQPVAAAADLVHARGGVLVCDAVQAAGRISCDFRALKADILLITAHKLGGPKGVGALVFARENLHIEHALIRGGGQEGGARGGTENIAAIAGFGAAAAEAFSARTIEAPRLAGLRDALERALLAAAPDLVIFGAGVERLPNTSSFALPGYSAETLLIALDLAGFAISSGSACSSGKVAASPVLSAMGIPADIARGALRVSLGWATTENDATYFCETFEKTVRNMRARRIKPAAQSPEPAVLETALARRT